MMKQVFSSGYDRNVSAIPQFTNLQLILLLVFITLGSFSGLNAQITIQSTDMPSAGDTIRTSIALNAAQFDFTTTGTNFLWDFSGLQSASQRLDTFKTVQQAPPIFFLSFFKSANLAVRLGAGGILPGIEFDDAWQFINKSTTSYRDFGYGLIIGGLPLPLRFTNPDVLYTFPMNMGQTTSSNANLEYAIPGIGYISIQRQRQNNVDGWGSVKTPYGQFQALRLKSTVYEIDSIYIDSIGQGIRIDRNYIEYKWLAKNQKVPVLQVTVDDVLGNLVVYRDSLRNTSVGLASYFEQDQSFTVYPNPARNELNFELCSSTNQIATLTIASLSGRLLIPPFTMDLTQGCYQYKLPLEKLGLRPGFFVLNVQIGNQRLSSRFLLID